MTLAVALAPNQAGGASPLQELSVGKFDVLRVLGEELVEPLEGSLVRVGDGEDDLVGALAVGLLALLGICGRDVGHHPACEGKLLRWCGSEVGLNLDISEADVGEEGLALQGLGKGLGLAGTDTVHEHADGVLVLALRVQVEHHCHSLVPQETPSLQDSLLAGSEAAVCIEEDLLLTIAKEKRRRLGGETDSHNRLGGRGLVATLLVDLDGLHDLNFEHVAASLDANVGLRAGDEVLQTSISEGGEDLAVQQGNDVEGGVFSLEDNLLTQLLTGVLRSINFLLLWGINLGLLLCRFGCGNLLGGFLGLSLLGRRCRGGLFLRSRSLRLGLLRGLLSLSFLVCCCLFGGHDDVNGGRLPGTNVAEELVGG
mmetsp:Transcript_76015/g.165881  ORF Transcript_76015/g.165881 Transcript_76015/m.165881 type:complete len:369 (+) Transcript_76015:2068-3174(+)